MTRCQRVCRRFESGQPLKMTRDEALEIVINAADEWAGEYGFSQPELATDVFNAISILEGRRAEFDTEQV